MTRDPQRDQWLTLLADRLAEGGLGALPRFAGEQVDAVVGYLDGDHGVPAEAASRIRSALAPLWLRGGPTLREARRDLRAGIDEGQRCPCCSKWVKRYRRRLNGAVVRSLAWLVLASDRSTEEGWVDVPREGPRWLIRGNPHPKLRLWGFAERREVEEGSGVRCSGLWRPTDRGRRFVDGLVDAPESVFELLSEVDAVSPERVWFRDVLDVAFDYDALMGWSS